MPDMLVRLYDLPSPDAALQKLQAEGVVVKQAIAPEKNIVVPWVEKTFGPGWAGECEAAFSNHPVSCFVAAAEGKMCGFACYDATALDFFGPTGVDAAFRGKGAGRALLLCCLRAMAGKGYGYAIIGGAGPVEFYKKAANAVLIEDSAPGIYKDMLRFSKNP